MFEVKIIHGCDTTQYAHDVVLTLWMLYGCRNDDVCLLGTSLLDLSTASTTVFWVFEGQGTNRPFWPFQAEQKRNRII